MKSVLYSGGQERANHKLHRALSQLAGRKKSKSFTYVPVWAESSAQFYARIRRRYSAHGFTRFNSLPIDTGPIPKNLLRKALKSDVIYLAGGNTFYFLKYLRKSGLLPHLKRFSKRGGILAGLSAGALILTPNIKLAGYPKFDCDDNTVKLKNLKALGLLKFEFFPHYSDNPRLRRALIAYSRKSKKPIFASDDGGGLVVNDDWITFYGKVYVFYRGKRTRMN